MVYIVLFFLMNFIFNKNLNIPKNKLLTFYILLMHANEYYFYENWNLVYNIYDATYDQ